jgi:hypothetical protein
LRRPRRVAQPTGPSPHGRRKRHEKKPTRAKSLVVARSEGDTTGQQQAIEGHRATIKAHHAASHHPRPYGILGRRLGLIPCGRPLEAAPHFQPSLLKT